MKRPLAISMVVPMFYLTGFVKITFSVTKVSEQMLLLCSAYILEKPHKNIFYTKILFLSYSFSSMGAKQLKLAKNLPSHPPFVNCQI